MNPTDLESVLSKLLQQEIDRMVLEEISIRSYLDKGWYLISVDTTDLDEIGPWMQENIHGSWRAYTDKWMFESEHDAIMFKLRWS